MKTVQLAIVGGGPAGLAAAAAAYDAGLRDILILERSGELGGILNQCIHAGFGLHTFHQELTGPEYAQRYIDAVHERGIPAWTDCMVLDVSPEKVLTVTGRAVGLQQIRAQAVVLAMGCRERPRGALNIAGTRPAGIWSAGTAQRMVNMEGYLPGRQVVILGSGDIGLIMARRMTLEGAEVKAVAEVMPYSGGLKRNIVQCLDDFDIPLYLSTTVVEIHGQEHLTGVTLAQVDDKRLPVRVGDITFFQRHHGGVCAGGRGAAEGTLQCVADAGRGHHSGVRIRGQCIRKRNRISLSGGLRQCIRTKNAMRW